MIGVLKKGWSFLFAIFSLMVFPQETLRFVLEDEPSYWYGELTLRGPDGVYVLAKNGNRHPIDPDLPKAKPLASVPLRRNWPESLPAQEVRPRSYALYLVDSSQTISSDRRARTSDGESFIVERLRVQSDAETGIAAWLLILLVVLLAILGGSIGYYFSDELDLLTDTSE